MADFRFRWRLALRDFYSLRAPARLVGHTLALHMEADGSSCFPGVDRLTRETSLHRATVFRALQELEHEGFLRRERRKGETSLYWPLIPGEGVAQSDGGSSHKATQGSQKRKDL